MPYCPYDNTVLDLKIDVGDAHALRTCITGLYLKRIRLGERGSCQGDSPGHLYKTEDVRFYRLFITLSDRSVREVTWYLTGCTGSDYDSAKLVVEKPAWMKALPCKLRSRDQDETGDFVIPDGPLGASAPVLKKMLSTLSAPSEAKHDLYSSTTEQSTGSHVNYAGVYDALVKDLISDGADHGVEQVKDLKTIVHNLKERLHFSPPETFKETL